MKEIGFESLEFYQESLGSSTTQQSNWVTQLKVKVEKNLDGYCRFIQSQQQGNNEYGKGKQGLSPSNAPDKMAIAQHQPPADHKVAGCAWERSSASRADRTFWSDCP